MNDGTYIGIDIGGTKTRVAYARGEDLHTFYEVPTPQDPAEAVAGMIEVLRTSDLPAAPAAVGIACPGPVDQVDGVVLGPPNLPHWERVEIVQQIQDALGVPVVLENDANAGALGETVRGSARGLGTVFYMTISTGIGTGIVINNRVHRGAFGLAGEIWAFTPALFQGATGDSIENTCSGNGIVMQAERRIRAGAHTVIPADRVTTRTILAAYAGGDALAVQLLETARQTLAATLCFAIHLLAPDAVVLGGGLCRDRNWFVAPIRERVREHLAIEGLKDIPVRRAELWDDAVSWGALALAREAGSAAARGLAVDAE